MRDALFTKLPRLEPSARALAIAEAVFPRRAGARGSISKDEARFLLSAIESCDAKTVVEVGVASGGSTLYMLAMLNELPGSRQLLAFDWLKDYYADASKPVGYLALESEFNVSDRLVLRGGACSADVRSTIARASRNPDTPIDLAFIDGDHRHPWSTIDLLLLLPLMREGGIVVLHDINLPVLTDSDQCFGPMHIFSRPFESRFVVRGERPNIGGVRVVDRAKMIDVAMEALDEPWEIRLEPALADRIVREVLGGPLASRAAAMARHFPGL